MDLKLTTKRVLEYEAKTGNDMIAKINEIGKRKTVKISEIVDLFIALGEGYTVEVFDAWDATFVEKAEAIFNAVKEYVQGSTKEKK